MSFLVTRIRQNVERRSARAFFRRTLNICLDRPIISFTFDDFPRSALNVGGEILKRFDLLGTYYTSLGLLGNDSPSGQIAFAEDLKKALEQGHELGCHTYSHCHSWQTGTKEFEDSINRNRIALSEIVAGTQFESFAYPISEPRPLTKRATAKYFRCCRAGGQKSNFGRTDLNQLSGYFLEKLKGNTQPAKEFIEANKSLRGWIIFATHDISSQPSRYGCTPEFFAEVVAYAVESGAQILPVAQALRQVCAPRLFK